MARMKNRVRVYKPKVKTGCVTCKSRRVKCDEKKPACMRCLKLSVPCGGYEHPVTKGKRETRRQLLPQSISSQDSSCDSDEVEYVDKCFAFVPPSSQQQPIVPVESSLTSRATTVATELPSVVFNIPTNPSSKFQFTIDESQYFRFFREVTASHHTGYFECKIWDNVMLQTSECEPFVKHGIVAVGALSKVWEGSQSLTTESGVSCTFLTDIVDADSNPHYCYALKQYDQSIKLMALRNLVRPDIRNTLIGCLLVICFENMVGNHYGALRQMIHGMKVLREWKSRNPDRLTHGSRPYEAIVENDVVDLFDRYSELFTEAQPLDPVSLDKSCSDKAITFIPRRFKSAGEARAYFGHVCLRTRHLNRDIPDLDFQLKSDFLGPSDLFPSGESTIPAWQYCTPSFLPLEKHAQQYTQLSEVTHLSLALEPLLEHTRSPLGAHDFPVTTGLQISAVLGQILILARCNATELFYDTQLPRFKELVKLCTSLIDYQTLGGKRRYGEIEFKFKTGIVKPLFIVAARCRDWSVRMEALNLLRDRKRRESIWDSEVGAAIAGWIIEAEGIGARYVAEEKRLRIVGVDLERDGKRAFVRAMDGCGNMKCGIVTW